MLAISGMTTTIADHLKVLLEPLGETFIRLSPLSMDGASIELPAAERYLLAAGALFQKDAFELTDADAVLSLDINFLAPMRMCERILDTQPQARICIIGSQSARAGSYDKMYAGMKAAIHAYALARKLTPRQQLVVVAPPIIADSGMTRRRKDYPEVLSTRQTVSALEVARLVKRVLYDMQGRPEGLMQGILPLRPRERLL